VIENGVVQQVTVQLGEREGNNYELVSGLKGSEVLAASNLNQLVSGVRIGDGDEEGAVPGGSPGSEAGERRGRGRGGRRGGGEGRGDAQ
jgi:hypothetical protein